MPEPALLIFDLVVKLRPAPGGAFEAGPELDSLDRVDGEDRLGQAPVQLAVPVHVAAKSERHAAGDDAEGAAECVAGLSHLVDVRDHAPGGVGVGAAHWRSLDLLDGHSVRVAAVEADVDRADRLREAQDLDPEVSQQLAGHAARGHARRRLACRGALQDVADVGVTVLQGAGQVRVTRPQPGHRLRLDAFFGRGHLRRPVGVVLVLEHQGHGAADGEAAAHSAHDAGEVGLDLLPAAAPMTALPSREVAAQVVLRDLEAGRQALDDHGQLRAVRFARGQEPEHSASPS